MLVYVAGEGWSGFQGSVQIDGGINEDWLKDNARCTVCEATGEAVTAGVDVIGTTAVTRNGTGSDGAGRCVINNLFWINRKSQAGWSST